VECVTTAREDLADSLVLAAERLGTHPAIRRIAVDEPSVLASLVTPTDMPLWGLVRSSVRDILVAAGVAISAGSIDLVVRWLTTFVVSPATDAADQAGLLADALLPEGEGPAWQDGHQ
jgi:hypothetical protein